jgi:Zn-dependent metalloprotease
MSALVMSAIGIEESAELFYNVMTKRLTANSQFADYRTALMEECKSQSSDTCAIVDDALSSVGI